MNKTDARFEFVEIPDKSPSDKKDYKFMVLENNLKVLLVSDNKFACNVNEDNASVNLSLNEQAKEKLSAVALMVDVGAFEQPKKFQGLAHFLEHMIFMGSKKYPEENSFSKYITKYGGYNNACTDGEETLYYFEVPEKHLDISMDYFMAQLKEPLLLQDSMAREREAVESEYQLNINNDEFLRYQMLQSLANVNYPHNNFILGNLKSLKEDIENDQDLHENLFEFYKRHYSAHRMFACIQSCLPLQQLEDLAIKHFADISSNWLPGLDFSQYTYKEAFKSESYENIFFVKSIKNVRRLDITWVLPPTLKLYKSKPVQLLACTLGYEGNGSLSAFLRKRLWAVQVIVESEPNPIFTVFNLTITLTDLGLTNLDEVLEATFSYIKLFNKASEFKEIFQEISFSKATSFRYAAEISPIDNVQNLVRCCKYFPPKDILTGSEIFFNFNENEVQNLLDHLNEFHFNIMLTTQRGYKDEVYDKEEKWFGIEYTSQKIPQKWIELWNNCQIMPELYMRQANPFIAHDFRIFWLEDGRQKLLDAPEKLMKTEKFELWFKQDDKFLLPHGHIYFNFMSPLLRKNSRNFVLCALYVDLVKHHLVNELYPATEAAICYQICCYAKGIFLAVDGYNEKLYLVVECIIKALIATKDRITESEMDILKKQLQMKNFNTLIKPEVVNMDLKAYILQQQRWLYSDKNKHISDIKLSEIQSFAEEFTQELYVQALIQGNLPKDAACAIMSTVIDHLNCSEIKEKSVMEDRATEIPLGCHKIVCHNLNPKDCSSVITNFYQIGPRSIRNQCILNLFIMILDAPLYDNLRTKQQLGYIVGCSIEINYGIMGYVIYVTSQETKHSASYVEKCIEEFRQGITTILNEISLVDFENFKNSLIKLKEIEDVTLSEEVNRNWSEITSEEYLFQRRFREIEVIKTLQKQDILEFWQKNESENLRQLNVQVVGFKTTEESSSINSEAINGDLELEFMDIDQDGTAVINVQEFKKTLHVYPVTKTEV